MYRMLLNGAEQAGGNPCETWGELLARVDAGCEERDWLVTAVRWDGVDVPAFRQADAGAHRLVDVALIEVDASSPRELLASSVDEGVRAAATLSAEAERIGQAFRGVDVTGANRELSEFAGNLRTLVALAGVLSDATGVSVERVMAGGEPASVLLASLVRFLDALIEAQEAGDWITVADIVEYDIPPALGRFPALLDALTTQGCSGPIPVVPDPQA